MQCRSHHRVIVSVAHFVMSTFTVRVLIVVLAFCKHFSLDIVIELYFKNKGLKEENAKYLVWFVFSVVSSCDFYKAVYTKYETLFAFS